MHGILIFMLLFGVSSVFMQKEPVEVAVPPAVTYEKGPQQDIFVIAIDGNKVVCTNSLTAKPSSQTFAGNDEELRRELTKWLLELKENAKDKVSDGTAISIKASMETSYQRVHLVMDALRETGLNKFTLMTSLKS